MGKHQRARGVLVGLLGPGLLLAAGAAFAHAGHGTMGAGGFSDGFLHPVTGLDHLVAMVAVGLWGAQLGLPALWVLPVAFPLVMAVGGFIGMLGVPLPGAVYGVALSDIVLGLAVAFALRPPFALAALIVALFAVFHGFTHGAALPLTGVPLAYTSGFVLATGLLHLCGIVIGLAIRWPGGAIAIRMLGLAVAAVGVAFLGAAAGLWTLDVG
ncbi:MAG: HupE/UreJ family protein [Thiotrichales bacterium]